LETVKVVSGCFSLAKRAGIDRSAVDFFFYLYTAAFASAFFQRGSLKCIAHPSSAPPYLLNSHFLAKPFQELGGSSRPVYRHWKSQC